MYIPTVNENMTMVNSYFHIIPHMSLTKPCRNTRVYSALLLLHTSYKSHSFWKPVIIVCWGDGNSVEINWELLI